jgi:hypothetical protein
LPHEQFNRLFARCPCGLTMTRRKFRQHECWQKRSTYRRREYIDLTQDTEMTVIDLTDPSDTEEKTIVVDSDVDE